MTGQQRRLAAILVADVVGFSRAMGADEAGTLAAVGALKREVIEPAIAAHAGRLFKAVGDGFLVEFASAVQAVTCALAIQRANEGSLLALRIGVHLGDVVVEGDDLMGDGVSVAARIEGVADAGGIASPAAFAQLGGVAAGCRRHRRDGAPHLGRCGGDGALARPGAVLAAFQHQHPRVDEAPRRPCPPARRSSTRRTAGMTPRPGREA